MQSMTGFGRGEAQLGQGRLVLEIKSVNHRFLEVRSRSPREMLSSETRIEQLLRKRLGRGYCTVSLWYEGNLGETTTIDKAALQTYLKSLIEVGEEMDLCLKDLIPVLASAPDVYSTPLVTDETLLNDALNRATNEALDKLVDMRKTEGQAMSNEIKDRLNHINTLVTQINTLAVGWPKIALKQIQERLKSLTANTEISVDPQRVEAEVAVLVDRADILEEVTRLKSHLDQMATLFDSDEPVGRKMGFILQEIGREANTIGSKAALPEITTFVVDVKAELEKIRELALNIE